MNYRFKITTTIYTIYTIGFMHGTIAGIAASYRGEHQALVTVFMIALAIVFALTVNMVSKNLKKK